MSSTESPFAPVGIPKPSIMHLMLWTACSAAYLAVTRIAYPAPGEMPENMLVVQQTSQAIGSIVFGAVLAGAIVLVHTRVRGRRPLLNNPGHWLLFISAVFGIVFLLFAALVYRLDGTAEGRSNATQLILPVYGLLTLLMAGAYGVAVLGAKEASWRVLFAVMALRNLVRGGVYAMSALGANSFFPILGWVENWGDLLLVFGVIGLSIWGLLSGTRRDWLHWTGVATWVATSSMSLIWQIASWLDRL